MALLFAGHSPRMHTACLCEYMPVFMHVCIEFDVFVRYHERWRGDLMGDLMIIRHQTRDGNKKLSYR